MKTIIRLATAGAVSALLVGAAWAGNMEARFSNTVVAKAPDGTTMKVFYDKPVAFKATIDQPGKPTTNAKGTWRVDGDKVCLTSDTTFGPFEANKEGCVALMGDKVGDKWQTPGKDTAGKDIKLDVTIVAGR